MEVGAWPRARAARRDASITHRAQSRRCVAVLNTRKRSSSEPGSASPERGGAFPDVSGPPGPLARFPFEAYFLTPLPRSNELSAPEEGSNVVLMTDRELITKQGLTAMRRPAG